MVTYICAEKCTDLNFQKFWTVSPKEGFKMERRTRINFGGREVDATQVDFKSIKEEWNEYQASDGTTLKLKVVLTDIFRLDQYDQDLNPIYVVKSSNVLSSSVPENLKKGATKVQVQ